LGLSLANVAAAADISLAEASRIERGDAPKVPYIVVASVCGVVGLDLLLKAYPGGHSVRDAGHAALLADFRSLAGREIARREIAELHQGATTPDIRNRRPEGTPAARSARRRAARGAPLLLAHSAAAFRSAARLTLGGRSASPEQPAPSLADKSADVHSR
jgi:hypothetical protein